MTKEEINAMINNTEKEHKNYTSSISRGNGKSLKTTLDFLNVAELINIVINNVLESIKAEIADKSYLSYDDSPRHIIDESWVFEIIDSYKTGSEDR